jgi:hypothetical protein
MHIITVYLLNLCLLVHLPHTFRQYLYHYQGATSNYIRCALKCEL